MTLAPCGPNFYLAPKSSEQSIDDPNTKWTAIFITACWEGCDATVKTVPLINNKAEAKDLREAVVELGLKEKGVEEVVKDLDKAGNLMASEVTLLHTNRKYKAGDGYVDELVKLSHSKLNFDLSPNKSQAIVVAGESGSGKTTFSRYGVRRLLQKEEHERDRTGVIYLTIRPTSRHKNMELKEQRGEYSDAGVLLRMLFAHCLRVFDDKSKEGNVDETAHDKAYYFVSTLSSEHNKERNEAARKVYDAAMSEFFPSGKGELKAWWEGRREDLVLDGLVIVMDEAGRSRYLARGLVDIARQIVADVVQGGERGVLAKKCKVVIAGTGLDEVDEELQEMTEITDPAKAQVVVAKRVDFKSRAFATIVERFGIKQGEILEGTISSVLAENARMLIDAILPSMTCGPLSKYYTEVFGEDLGKNIELRQGRQDGL